MKTAFTYIATIHLGLREMYTDVIRDIDEVKSVCQKFVNEEKSCVTIVPCDFIYVDGSEPGAKIEFIQYPRFEKPTGKIDTQALKLGEILMKEFKQFRVSITTNEYTYMLENELN